MTDNLPFLQIRGPRDFNTIRGFVEKNRALGIEGFERLEDRGGQLSFMLGFQNPGEPKPTFVAGVRTQIWEFSDHIEDRLRRALGIERPPS